MRCASNRATVVFPEAAGPSIAICNGVLLTGGGFRTEPAKNP